MDVLHVIEDLHRIGNREQFLVHLLPQKSAGCESQSHCYGH